MGGGVASYLGGDQWNGSDRKPERPKEVGTFRARVREFSSIQPHNGIIQVRFTSTPHHEAMIQAIELIPAPASPQTVL
jgi:hypothetical protein